MVGSWHYVMCPGLGPANSPMRRKGGFCASESPAILRNQGKADIVLLRRETESGKWS